MILVSSIKNSDSRLTNHCFAVVFCFYYVHIPILTFDTLIISIHLFDRHTTEINNRQTLIKFL